MRLRHLGLSLVFAALGAPASARAACTVTRAAPTSVLPTPGPGETFTFVATDECTDLKFAPLNAFWTKVPVQGARVGRFAHAYSVKLTQAEWTSLTGASAEAVVWTIKAMSASGTAVDLPTTNELDNDGDGWTRTDGDVSRCDYDASVNPGAVDLCDGIDQNCNGTLDDEICPWVLLVNADAELIGEEENSDAGVCVAGAGDIDGDGHDDLLVGAPRLDDTDEITGAAYIVMGPVTGHHNLSRADATFVGQFGDQIGASLAGGGDLDGDGRDDIVIGNDNDDTNGDSAGAVYVLSGPLHGDVDESVADATLLGEREHDFAGIRVAGAGDVNGDGHDDLLVGAYLLGGDLQGAAYVVFGPITGTHELAASNAKLEGAAPGDYSGQVAGAGDMDGDGFDDVLVGGYGVSDGGASAGAVYLVMGPMTGVADLDSAARAELVGEDLYDCAATVAGGGDIDGDGHTDIVVGAIQANSGVDPAEVGTGEVYVVLGPVSGDIDLADADAKLLGESVFDFAGGAVAIAGDVDADGTDDLLVGAELLDGLGQEDSGGAYLVFSPVSGSMDLAAADVRFFGEQEDDHAGASVAGVGDVDGDGRADVLIGSRLSDAVDHPRGDRDYSGGAFLFYGSNL